MQANLFAHAHDTDETHALDAGLDPMPSPAPKARKIQGNLFTHAYDGTDETHALDA